MAALWLAAPRFTAEDERNESLGMSEVERESARADLYGTNAIRCCVPGGGGGRGPGGGNSPSFSSSSSSGGGGWGRSLSEVDTSSESSDPVSADEEGEQQQGRLCCSSSLTPSSIIDCRLDEMEEALLRIPMAEKEALIRAQTVCPDLIEKRIFFECDDGSLSPERAAQKLCLYWQKRLDFFGPEKAFRPLTLHDALRDDESGFDVEYYRRIPDDDNGRAVFFSDPRKYKPTKPDRLSVLRAQFYLLDSTAREMTCPHNGAVVLTYAQKVEAERVDRKIGKELYGMDEYMPLRIRAYHLVHPPWYFRHLRPVESYIMGRRNRARFRVHKGSRELVLESLKKFGLNRCHLPTAIGGEWEVLNIDDWIRRRRKAGL